MGIININITKAKELAHKYRRMSREIEFVPYDEIIAKQIPGKDAIDAENNRVMIRQNYAKLQLDIDNTDDILVLKDIARDFIVIIESDNRTPRQ